MEEKQPLKKKPLIISSASKKTSQGTYTKRVKHNLWSDDDGRLKYVNYAYKLGGLRFVALLEAENGLWSIDRKSLSSYYVSGSRWVHGEWRQAGRYRDYGFCQISEGYHPHIVRDERFFTDWKWQIDKCYELYSGGTTFYGANNIHKTIKRFTEL